MEGFEAAAYGLVAVLQKVPADKVDAKYDDPENSERPAEAQTGYHGAHGKGVYQSSQAGPGGGNALCDTSSSVKPLRSDTNTADKEEAHSPAEANTLAQEDVPFLCSER